MKPRKLAQEMALGAVLGIAAFAVLEVLGAWWVLYTIAGVYVFWLLSKFLYPG